MTASNFVEIPRELFARLVAAIETPDDLNETERSELIEDVQQFAPEEDEHGILV